MLVDEGLRERLKNEAVVLTAPNKDSLYHFWKQHKPEAFFGLLQPNDKDIHGLILPKTRYTVKVETNIKRPEGMTAPMRISKAMGNVIVSIKDASAISHLPLMEGKQLVAILEDGRIGTVLGGDPSRGAFAIDIPDADVRPGHSIRFGFLDSEDSCDLAVSLDSDEELYTQTPIYWSKDSVLMPGPAAQLTKANLTIKAKQNIKV